MHAENLAKEAAAKGHHVTLVTSAHPSGIGSENRDGYEVLYLEGTHFSMSLPWLEPWWIKSTEKISELAAAGKADVVWAENLAGQYYAGLPAAPGKAKLITIVNGPAIRGELLNRWAEVSSVPSLFYFLTRSLGQTLLHLAPWFRRAMAGSDFIICVSDYCEREVRREYSSSRGKVTTIYNQVNTSMFFPDDDVRRAARETYGLALSAPVIAMSGVLSRQKGMHVGLEAFARINARLPEARLIIGGDGPEMARLRELSRRLGIADSVVFAGRLQNRRMNDLCNAADIYVNPTLRREGLPLAILEALACSRPCVTTKVGGTESSIEEGVSGFFVRPGDAAGLAETTLRLLTDKELLRAMGLNARRRAVEVFNPDRLIGEYLKISAELLSGSHK